MKNRILLALMVPALCLLGCNKQSLTPRARNLMGAADTAGGDLHSIDYGAAWFLGTRPVRYCVEWSPSFGVDRATASQSVSDAIEKWRKYIQEKGVNARQLPDGRQLPDFQLATEFEAVPKCTGSEDLTFYFAVSTPEIEAARKTFDHPISFAHRASYDMNQGWGRGFLWFAPPGTLQRGGTLDWKVPYVLSGMLLHELGHVFGCGHVGGTIMERDIARMATDPGIFDPKSWMSEIDRTRELFLCAADCEHTYPGRFGEFWDNPDSAPSAAMFHRLMERDPKGNIVAEVTYRDKAPHGLDRSAELTLHVADDLGAVDFPISLDKEDVGFPGEMSVFVRTRYFDPRTGIIYMSENLGTIGVLLTGTLRSTSGTIYPIWVQRNWMGEVKTGPNTAVPVASPMRIDLLVGTTRLPLFSAKGLNIL